MSWMTKEKEKEKGKGVKRGQKGVKSALGSTWQ
jgi:hypothetical protein